MQASATAEGTGATSAVSQSASNVLRMADSGYDGVYLDHADEGARLVLPIELVRKSLDEGAPPFELKTLLAGARTDATAAQVAAALARAPRVWVMAGTDPQGRMGLAEARDADGSRRLEVYSHPLELLAPRPRRPGAAADTGATRARAGIRRHPHRDRARPGGPVDRTRPRRPLAVARPRWLTARAVAAGAAGAVARPGAAVGSSHGIRACDSGRSRPGRGPRGLAVEPEPGDLARGPDHEARACGVRDRRRRARSCAPTGIDPCRSNASPTRFGRMRSSRRTRPRARPTTCTRSCARTTARTAGIRRSCSTRPRRRSCGRCR